MSAELNRWRGAWIFAVFMFAIAVADAVLYYHATGTLGRLDIVLATAIVIAQWAVERRKVDPNPDAIFATIALLLLTRFGG